MVPSTVFLIIFLKEKRKITWYYFFSFSFTQSQTSKQNVLMNEAKTFSFSYKPHFFFVGVHILFFIFLLVWANVVTTFLFRVSWYLVYFFLFDSVPSWVVWLTRGEFWLLWLTRYWVVLCLVTFVDLLLSLVFLLRVELFLVDSISWFLFFFQFSLNDTEHFVFYFNWWILRIWVISQAVGKLCTHLM